MRVEGGNPKGKLYNKYHNEKSRMRQEGLQSKLMRHKVQDTDFTKKTNSQGKLFICISHVKNAFLNLRQICFRSNRLAGAYEKN